MNAQELAEGKRLVAAAKATGLDETSTTRENGDAKRWLLANASALLAAEERAQRAEAETDRAIRSLEDMLKAKNEQIDDVRRIHPHHGAHMRDLSKVIDAMLEHVPASEARLVDKLKSVRNSSLYTAPEVMGAVWRSVQNLLVCHVGEPTETWQHKVHDIFVGKSEDQ